MCPFNETWVRVGNSHRFKNSENDNVESYSNAAGTCSLAWRANGLACARQLCRQSTEPVSTSDVEGCWTCCCALPHTCHFQPHSHACKHRFLFSCHIHLAFLTWLRTEFAHLALATSTIHLTATPFSWIHLATSPTGPDPHWLAFLLFAPPAITFVVTVYTTCVTRFCVALRVLLLARMSLGCQLIQHFV
jgi:hypothetical protein